jgi:hypothetical protein
VSVQKAELVTCEAPNCYGTLIFMGGGLMTAREAARASGWQVGVESWLPWDDRTPDVCPACMAGRGPITVTPCPSCGGCGGNLICIYCGAEQPRDVED